jgi:hypothetical protein
MVVQGFPPAAGGDDDGGGGDYDKISDMQTLKYKIEPTDGGGAGPLHASFYYRVSSDQSCHRRGPLHPSAFSCAPSVPSWVHQPRSQRLRYWHPHASPATCL